MHPTRASWVNANGNESSSGDLWKFDYYMHNGYLKSLKQVVHFYNTRDVLPRCTNPLDPRAGTDCWPAAEVSANETKSTGNLGLSGQEEDAIVAFLKTLTDGYTHVRAP